jgi:dihydropteroate synthase
LKSEVTPPVPARPALIEEEWRRIEPLITFGAQRCELWVDTHRGEIAKRAVAEGVRCINDISGGHDPALLEIVAESGVRCVLMYSTSGRPHEFSPGPQRHEIVAHVNAGLCALRSRALSRGLASASIVLDTGMGAFLGSDPDLSWEILRNYHHFFDLGHDMLLGCSRKGFLRTPNEGGTEERDLASAFGAFSAAQHIPASRTLFIRAHNTALHLEFLRLQEKLR